MIDTTPEPTANDGFIEMASAEEYAARTAKSDQTRGYLVPGYLSA